uniref:Arrestin C-terminal-like domain-containing protein n=2 Tax=Parascaris univalens TaxID=6257 RepID=A0A914ZWL1_PARUN
ERSVVRLTCPSTVIANKPFPVIVEFDFVHSVSVASLTGYFEGIVRTAFSSQSELRSLSAIRLDFDSLVRQWRSATGKLRALAGHYIHESRIAIGNDTPGTFFAKNGAIEYAITVRLRMNGRFGQSELLQIRPVIVLPIMDISQFIRYRAPIRIHKIFRRKLLCFSKTNTSITIELEKAAFVQGERIMVHGQILNENPSNPVKGGLVELIITIRCRCKGNEKNSATTVAHFPIATDPLQPLTSFDHALQVPVDAYPTFSCYGALVQCSYHISVGVHECPAIEIPVVIGTGKPATPIAPSFLAIMSPEHRSAEATKSSSHTHSCQLPPFCPLPPPPYAFASYGAPPKPALFIPEHITYRNMPPLSQFCSKPFHRTMQTEYKGQSILKIEEIE